MERSSGARLRDRTGRSRLRWHSRARGIVWKGVSSVSTNLATELARRSCDQAVEQVRVFGPTPRKIAGWKRFREDRRRVDFPRSPTLVGAMNLPAGRIGADQVAGHVEIDAVVEVHNEWREQRLELPAVRHRQDRGAEVHPDAVVVPESWFARGRVPIRIQDAGKADEVLDVASAVFRRREVGPVRRPDREPSRIHRVGGQPLIDRPGPERLILEPGHRPAHVSGQRGAGSIEGQVGIAIVGDPLPVPVGGIISAVGRGTGSRITRIDGTHRVHAHPRSHTRLQKHRAVGPYCRQHAIVVIGIGVGDVEAAGVGSGDAVRSAQRSAPRRWRACRRPRRWRDCGRLVGVGSLWVADELGDP